MDMVQVSIELPRNVFSALRQDPEGQIRANLSAANNHHVHPAPPNA